MTPRARRPPQTLRRPYCARAPAGRASTATSADPPKPQKKFKEKYALPCPLIADEDKKVSSLYGVIREKSMYGKLFKGISRMSFLIGPDGKIKKIFDPVKPAEHAEEVLAA